MNEEQKSNELPDSLEWGTSSKGAKKKVYGDMNTAPSEFGRKIMIMKAAERLALGELTQGAYENYVMSL